MRYTVRKGLESPCMIRGFLSSDYWIFVGCCAAALVLLFLSVRTGIMTGTGAQTQEKGKANEIQGIEVRHDRE